MITLDAIAKRFGRFVALDDVHLALRDGELLALLGPSGSGKTTLLRVIAGLEAPDAGTVAFDGEDITRAPATDRGVGFVFQHYALFRHLTVGQNIAFGLEVKRGGDRPGPAAIAAKVHALLDLVALPGMADRRPGELSGGQRQRVALARALAVDPKILLLDEPFGALDATVRRGLRRELRRIHDATGVTTLFVTHDQDEALELADRVAVLNAGRIEQVGTPAEVLGDGLRIEGEVSGGVFRGGGMEIGASGVADGPAAARVQLFPRNGESGPAAQTGGSLGDA